MAVTVEHIYLSLQKSYDIKLVAGVQGIKSVVDWVHMVETMELIPFLKPRELVMITGIGEVTQEMLLTFCEKLNTQGIGGLMIHMGPYITQVSQSVIDFCDATRFPILILHEEAQLMDVMHEACHLIFAEEQLEESITEQFKDALFAPEKVRESEMILARNGFVRETHYCMIALKLVGQSLSEVTLRMLQVMVEKSINPINGHYILFMQDQILYVVTADFKEQEKKEVVSRFSKLEMNTQHKLYIAVGPNCKGLMEIVKYYPRVESFLKLMERKERFVVWYETLDVYKLLLDMEDKSDLRAYHKRTIGRLLEYDALNETHYYELLKHYLDKNGCIKEIASEYFIHRNTVAYQLKKIEKILEVNLENWGECLKLYLAFLIQDLL